MANKEEGKTQYIRTRLLEARNEDDLEDICTQLKAEPDIKPGTVDSEKSRLKKKGAFKFEPQTTKALVTGKPMSVEEIVETLPWPVDVDGKANPVFVAGMKYEAFNVIRGIRLAQELSKMGIDQAGPIIKMAQEMRQTEGQVAKETGMAMGAEIAGKMFDYMEQKLPAKSDIAMAPDPFRGLAARTLETMMNRMIGTAFGGQPGPTPGLVDKRTQK